MSKVCVITTYKNNYRLFNAFYNFYSNVWKAQHFVIYCGITELGIQKDKVLELIENKTSKFNNIIKINDSNEYVKNIYLYKNSNASLFIYDTQDIYEQNIEGTNGTQKIFDGIVRPFLFKLSNYLDDIFNEYLYYLSVDQDDFLYVNNLEESISKHNKDIWFKTLEYIPNEIFNKNDNMNFSEIGYYFLILFNNNNTIPNKIESFNLEGYTGIYHNTIDYYQRKIKIMKKNTFFETINGEARCGHWEKYININKDKIENENIAFCFGCLDLDYLINERNFYKTEKDSPDSKLVSYEKKINDFNKYFNRLDLTYCSTYLLNKYFIDYK